MPDIYLAGELFSAKHLLGNAALADHLARESGGRFRGILPQALPQPDGEPRAIRDADLLALLACDAAVFQYDGLELDSGTVVEYMAAKFADIPAILLRTDFRHAGDQKEGDPWNLMNSFYPRTVNILVNSMQLFQEALSAGETAAAAADAVTRDAAAQVCAALEKVLAMPPVLPRAIGPAVYEWLALMPGRLPGGPEGTARLFSEKVAKKLL
ncbi:MAG TPA: nucleoside 2-deoxyribosyltransferase [Chthoniobacteraceae bacterium]|jgi:nucleoside 2-deoxyribosyltransferase|nr:nucleoside 2-deoxyribosyltransferase [Chthoniobacteraceae bacterium]